jgi:hypothetical protein
VASDDEPTRVQRIGGAGNSIKTVWHPIFLTGRNQTIVKRFQSLSHELCFHIGLAVDACAGDNGIREKWLPIYLPLNVIEAGN